MNHWGLVTMCAGALFCVGTLLVVSCGGAPQVNTEIPEAEAVKKVETADDMPGTQQTAVARLSPTEGNRVTGTVTFVKTGDQITVKAEVMGLTPGKHGFHIHEKGDCSAPDGTSAGGHFNPGMVDHAGHDADVRHVGDLGNLIADESGRAILELSDKMVSFDGPHSIIGRGIIVHEKEDDLTSQPTGAAGPRVACGVIELQ